MANPGKGVCYHVDFSVNVPDVHVVFGHFK